MSKTIYITIRYILVVIILFVIQKLFNCFVYKTDGISVLFGIFFLAFGIILQYSLKDYFDRLHSKIVTKKYRKIIDKRLQEWEDSYKNESK